MNTQKNRETLRRLAIAVFIIGVLIIIQDGLSLLGVLKSKMTDDHMPSSLVVSGVLIIVSLILYLIGRKKNNST